MTWSLVAAWVFSASASVYGLGATVLEARRNPDKRIELWDGDDGNDEAIRARRRFRSRRRRALDLLRFCLSLLLGVVLTAAAFAGHWYVYVPIAVAVLMASGVRIRHNRRVRRQRVPPPSILHGQSGLDHSD